MFGWQSDVRDFYREGVSDRLVADGGYKYRIPGGEADRFRPPPWTAQGVCVGWSRLPSWRGPSPRARTQLPMVSRRRLPLLLLHLPCPRCANCCPNAGPCLACRATCTRKKLIILSIPRWEAKRTCNWRKCHLEWAVVAVARGRRQPIGVVPKTGTATSPTTIRLRPPPPTPPRVLRACIRSIVPVPIPGQTPFNIVAPQVRTSTIRRTDFTW